MTAEGVGRVWMRRFVTEKIVEVKDVVNARGAQTEVMHFGVMTES